jgi:hypothetical protein
MNKSLRQETCRLVKVVISKVTGKKLDTAVKPATTVAGGGGENTHHDVHI